MFLYISLFIKSMKKRRSGSDLSLSSFLRKELKIFWIFWNLQRDDILEIMTFEECCWIKWLSIFFDFRNFSSFLEIIVEEMFYFAWIMVWKLIFVICFWRDFSKRVLVTFSIKQYKFYTINLRNRYFLNIFLSFDWTFSKAVANSPIIITERKSFSKHSQSIDTSRNHLLYILTWIKS